MYPPTTDRKGDKLDFEALDASAPSMLVLAPPCEALQSARAMAKGPSEQMNLILLNPEEMKVSRKG